MNLSKITSSKLLLPAVALFAITAGFGLAVLFSQSRASVNAENCQGICVNIEHDQINPNELAVKVGEFVQFNSKDGRVHNLALGNGTGHHGDSGHEDDPVNNSHEHLGSLQSGEFGADEAWRVQFTDPGTFIIHDHNNPELSILVVVYGDVAPLN